MDYLKKIIIEIRYKDVTPMFDIWGNLIKSLTGNSQIPSLGGQIPPQSLQIKLNDRSALVVVENTRCALSTIKITDRDDLKNFSNNIFQKINNFLKWNQLERIGIRTFWIDSSELPFDELVSNFKSRIYTGNSLIRDASDAAISLTLYNNEDRINYNTGPMKKSQLISQFISEAINDNDFPDTCLFVDTDYIRLVNKEYKSKYFQNLFDIAFAYSKAKAQETFNLFK